jgi:hypothetical protein
MTAAEWVAAAQPLFAVAGLAIGVGLFFWWEDR